MRVVYDRTEEQNVVVYLQYAHYVPCSNLQR